MLELVFCQFEPDNTWNQRFLSWLNMCHGLLDFLWPDEELSNMNWSIFDSGPSVNLTWAISVVSAHKPLNFTSLSHASVLQLCWMWHGLKQANPSFISPHFSLSLSFLFWPNHWRSSFCSVSAPECSWLFFCLSHKYCGWTVLGDQEKSPQTEGHFAQRCWTGHTDSRLNAVVPLVQETTTRSGTWTQNTKWSIRNCLAEVVSHLRRWWLVAI